MLRHRIAEEKRVSTTVVTKKDVSSPAGDLDSKYLEETLRYCIAQLPEHLRNVITLRDLAELSYTQISRILGISAATAKVYRCKAVQVLAVWMKKEDKRGNESYEYK
jgi:RNA polymerase sigma factor (sigma-70 family)